MQKQIIYIDASSLKDCAGCFRKYYLNNLKGYNPINDKEYKMAYGTAFHYFVEGFYNKLPLSETIEKAVNYYTQHLEGVVFPEDEYKTPSHLISVCKKYAETFSSDCIEPLRSAEGKPLTECKFAIPWFHTPEHEFILCGTIDLCAYYDGVLCLIDHKTTSTYFANADMFLKLFEMDIQVILYCYIYKTLHGLETPPHFLVNGIFLKRQTAKAAKDGIFDGVNFKRSSVITITNEKLLEFSVWLERWKTNMLELLNIGALFDHPNFAYCKTAYGACKYFSICSAPIDCREGIIEHHFIQKEYNPLKFRGD